MKKYLVTFLLVAFCSAAFISCGGNDSSSAGTEGKETTPSFDLAAAKTGIEATNAEFGDFIAKGDSVGIASLYTSDAKVMGGNMPAVSGRAAIQSTFAGLLSMGIGSGKLTTTEVWGINDLVAEEGTYTLTSKDGAEMDKGKYIVLWKMEDGKWKLFRDCFNSDLPASSGH